MKTYLKLEVLLLPMEIFKWFKKITNKSDICMLAPCVFRHGQVECPSKTKKRFCIYRSSYFQRSDLSPDVLLGWL